MSKLCSFLLFAIMTAISVHPQEVRNEPRPVVFSNATVIDVKSGKRQRNMTVVLTNDRIAAVGKRNRVKTPADALIIDATGKFLIPGLWDMHVHAWDADVFYPIILANGVTGIRDMGDDVKSLAAFRRQIESGKRMGPRLFFAGQIIDGLRRETLPFLFSYVSSPEEAREIVRQRKAGGADFIKVYNALTPDAYAAVADEAKKQNLEFAGHVPVSIGARAASIAGQSTIEHLSGVAKACSADENRLSSRAEELLAEMRRFDDNRMKETGASANEMRRKTYEISNRLYELTDGEAFDGYDAKKCEELNKIFRKQNTWHVPTLAVIGGNSLRADSARLAAERLQYFPEFVRGLILQDSEKTASAEQIASDKRRFQTKLLIVRQMHLAKVPLLAGSDSPNGNVYPGFSLHDELEFLVIAGLTPLAALQTATLNPAVYFKKTSDFGTVEAGKYADLLLLDADPLEDIKNTRRIRAVAVNGRLLTRDTLDKMLTDAAAKYKKNNSPAK